MKKVELKDVETYEAPCPFGMTAMRLQGKEETGAQKFWMGLSHFLRVLSASVHAINF